MSEDSEMLSTNSKPSNTEKKGGRVRCLEEVSILC